MKLFGYVLVFAVGCGGSSGTANPSDDGGPVDSAGDTDPCAASPVCVYDPVTGGFEGWYDCNGLLHSADAGYPVCVSWVVGTR